MNHAKVEQNRGANMENVYHHRRFYPQEDGKSADMLFKRLRSSCGKLGDRTVTKDLSSDPPLMSEMHWSRLNKPWRFLPSLLLEAPRPWTHNVFRRFAPNDYFHETVEVIFRVTPLPTSMRSKIIVLTH